MKKEKLYLQHKILMDEGPDVATSPTRDYRCQHILEEVGTRAYSFV